MISPFHAHVKARSLQDLRTSDKFVASFASNDIEIYPYQVAAATFALRSPFIKGAILCDEGSLGKTYEALLIIGSRFFEGKEKIIIIVPTTLLHQWANVMDNKFNIPFCVVDIGTDLNFDIQGVVLTTYDFAAQNAAYISQIKWDISVFEEAHCLRRIYTGENKTASTLRTAVGDSYKLLLTATPMQNSIMDLYGLIYFIDETALPDSDAFYKRYFRKPENYPELASWISKYCFRTMRGQVATYVKITERIPITIDFTLTAKEQKLQSLLDAYLARDKKYAFPKMDLYDLTLMLNRYLSSSTYAFAKTLQGIEKRLGEMEDTKGELDQIQKMQTLANEININAKGKKLLNVLKIGFAELKKLGANKKVLVFTENRETQKYLYDLLNGNGYNGKVLKFNGDHSRDYTIMERFEKEATILITTDIAAEGFNLELCSFVVNYDLPYNALTLEQRINRCHRQGQRTDVLVVNFLNKNNFADVRVLELINKRILQYDGIIGLSDNVIGNIGTSLNRDFSKIMATAKSKEEIDKAFDEVLADYKAENKQLVKSAEEMLFTTFDKDIAQSVAVSPQYLKERVAQANSDLWEVTKYFFGKWREFSFCEETRTLNCPAVNPPKVFIGTALRRNEYSMVQGYQPASGRHTVAGNLTKNILSEMFWVGLPDKGSIVVAGEIEPCEIGFYRVKVKSPADYFSMWHYNVFVGKNKSGHILTHDECAEIMEMPVVSFTTMGQNFGGRDGANSSKSNHEFDSLVQADEYVRRTVESMDGVIKEEMERLKRLTKERKVALERNIEALRSEVATLVGNVSRASNVAEKVAAEKRKAAMQKELKQKEQQLFMDGLRLDVELDKQVQTLTDGLNLTAVVEREFVIRVEVLS